MIVDRIEKASTVAVLSEWNCQSEKDKKREWERRRMRKRERKKVAKENDERWRKSVMMDANSFQSSLLLEMSGLAWMHYYVCTCS